MLKTDFERLGGYDERLQLGWGQDDRDLARRALAIGLSPMDIPCDSEFTRVIAHDDQERTRYTRYASMKESQEAHRKLTIESVERGEFIANIGRKWGSAKVEVNFRTLREI